MTTLHRIHELAPITRSPEGFLDSLAEVVDEATWHDDDFLCEPLRDPVRPPRRAPAHSPRGTRRGGPIRSAPRGGSRGLWEKDR
jgi:hypothetical protein